MYVMHEAISVCGTVCGSLILQSISVAKYMYMHVLFKGSYIRSYLLKVAHNG